MDKDKLIQDRTYRKNLSIAFFNSTNSAIEIIKLGKKSKTVNKKTFEKWRDYFLDEHKKYYASVIEKIGVNYKPEDTITKLRKAKTIVELKSIWISLSEDERHNANIIAETNRLKANFLKENETAQKH